MIVMKRLFLLAAAVSLSGCSGASEQASGSAPAGDNADPGIFNRYTESYPLVYNSNASAHKVLLMGSSHAAGL